jgi:hypothetical protein
MKQLDLWEQSEASRALTIGDIIEVNWRWANDGSSPEQLERLADLLKGRREVSDWHIKPAYWYRVLDTRIEGDHVVCTCRLVESPLGPSQRTENDNEGEEDYD